MERKRFVWCASQTCWCQSSQVFGRVWFVFVSGMNALNVKLLKAHWHQCSIEAMSYSYLSPETLLPTDLVNHKSICSRALFCKSPCWRSKRSHTPSSSPKLASNWREESDTCTHQRPAPEIVAFGKKRAHIAPAPTAPAKTGCIGLICPAGVIGARVCAVGVCSSGAQCQGDEDDEASEKTDWRHGNCQHRAK